MNIPSIKTIMQLTADKAKAQQIRRVMEDSGSLSTIDSILGTCGVEFIPHGHNAKSPAIRYCNTGDPYTPTVMRVDGRFAIGCWGDIVERGHYD